MPTGLNGRVYDSSGKRIESTVSHPELRSDRELRAAAQARQPQQPSGVPDPNSNPHRRTIAEHVKHKGPVWAKSLAGREWIIEHEAEADEWDRQRAAQLAELERVESVRPLVEHAQLQVQQVFDDGLCSVEDCERAADALAAARAGNRAAYVQWEKSRHDQVTTALATQAAEFDQQARAAIEKRNAVLASALEPTPVPEVRKPMPIMDVPIDRSKVAITRKVATEHGYREVTEIVDAQ